MTLCASTAYADLDSSQGVLVAFDRLSGLVYVLQTNATFPEAEAQVIQPQCDKGMAWMFTKTIVLAHPGWAALAQERLQRPIAAAG